MNIKKMTKNLDRDFVGSEGSVNGDSGKYTGVKPSLTGNYGWKQNAKMYGGILAGSLAMAFGGYGCVSDGTPARMIGANSNNQYAAFIMNEVGNHLDKEQAKREVKKSSQGYVMFDKVDGRWNYVTPTGSLIMAKKEEGQIFIKSDGKWAPKPADMPVVYTD